MGFSFPVDDIAVNDNDMKEDLDPPVLCGLSSGDPIWSELHSTDLPIQLLEFSKC